MFGRTNRSVGGAALVIALFGIVSRLLGFLRDRVLAGTFGAGDVLDAYYAAFRIPDLLYGLLVAGALSAAFVPVFTELHEKKGEQEAWQLTSGILSLIVLFLGVFGAIAFVFARPLVEVLVPGFFQEKQSLAVLLTRVMLLGPIFLGMSAVFGGVLVSFRNFIVFSLAPILYNIGIIIGAVFFVPIVGPVGLAWGVVLGTVLHAGIQYPSIRRLGFRFSLGMAFVRDATVWKVVRLMVPRSLGMAVNQIGFLVAAAFASVFASGTLAALTLATNIESVPFGLFGIAFSLAAFPTLSQLSAKGDRSAFFETILRTSRQILFFVLPASVLLVVLRAQVVRVILGTGAFDWDDTRLTLEMLGILSASLFAQSLVPLFARAFYAIQDTKTPLLLALISEVVHIALLVVLRDGYGPFALALSFTLASILNALLLFAFLRARLPEWNDRALAIPVFKMSIASLAALAAAQAGKLLFGIGDIRIDTFFEVLFQLLLSGVLGIGTFLAVAWLLGIEELERVRSFCMARIFRRPEVIKESEEELV